MADSGSDATSDCENDVHSYQIANMKHQSLEQSKRVAKELAVDIVYYKCNDTSRSRGNLNVYARTLRRTVDEISVRHEILFNSMVNKLNISNENCFQTFQNVVEEMFRDRHYNWGRIVTVYAFGGRLAKHCQDVGRQESIQYIAEFVGDYVSEKLTPWISSQGGWDTFVQFFPDKNEEGTLWKGLLYTVFGLGALATMVAAR